MESKELYFIRHGETAYNKRGIVQGSGIDEPINETGSAQALAFFEHYQAADFQLVMVSKLQRTRQTVQRFIDEGTPVLADARLNEMSWGTHEGQSPTPEMMERYRNMMAAWDADDFDAKLPEGESARELKLRLTEFLEYLVKRPESKILICTHGRAIRCLCCLFNGNHLREMERHGHSNTGLFKVNWSSGGGFSIELKNDLRHLDSQKNVTAKNVTN